MRTISALLVRKVHSRDDADFCHQVLARFPGFTLTAIATLALTIGAVSTVLTLHHALFRQPLPVPHPDDLVEVRATRDRGTESGFVSYPDYVHFRDSTDSLQDLAAVYPTAPLYVTRGDRARQVNGAVVSANFFSLLELEPTVGRFFRPDEDRVPGRDRVAVLGHDFWRGWFGGTDAVIGATLEVNDVSFTVVGVAPASFPGIGTRQLQIYLPTMMLSAGYRWCDDALAEDCTILRMLGRLADGVGIAEADAEMAALLPPQWRDAEPGDNSGISVVSARRGEPGPATTRFTRLLALVAGVLLLVCCANLAGLLVARGRARVRELAIRTSLGASRGRLFRQLVTEALLLAALGGGLGILLSAGFTRLLQAAFFSVDGSGRPLHYDFRLEPAVLLSVLGVSLLTGLLFGLLSALSSVRLGEAAGLERRGADTVAHPGSHRWLIGFQAAAAVTLAVVAGLLVGSAAGLLRGVGFDPEGVALLRLRPRLVEYSPPEAQEYVRSVVDRLRALPGVESVSMVGTGVALFGLEAEVSGPTDAGAGALRTGYMEIGPGYFETLRTPVLRGREFGPRDDPTSPPVALVSETLARRLWPRGDALGSSLRVNDLERTVVGIVADVPLQNRAEPPRPYAYVPFWQDPDQVDARLQVRVDGDPAVLLPTLARQVRRVDPDVPVTETITLEERLAGAFRPLRMTAVVASYAGAVAIVLSALGLYASLAAAVARRRREMGIRQALGACSREIVGLIAGEGLRVVFPGVIAGLALALAGARLLRHSLYGSAGADVLLYGGVALLVTMIGLLVSWIPGRRAARVDPAEALRAD